MAVRNIAKLGRSSLLALAVAAVAVPAIASARPNDGDRPSMGDRSRRGGESQDGNRGQTQSGWANRGTASGDSNGQSRGWDNGARTGGGWQVNRPQPAQAPVAQPNPVVNQPSARWTGNQDGDRRGGNAWQGSTSRGTGNAWSGDRDRTRDQDRDRTRDNDRSRDGDRTRTGDRTYDNRWSGNSRDRDRDGDRYRGTQTRSNDQWRTSPWQQAQRNRYGHDRDWNRSWRNNHRYDWYSYRRYNPSIYRWGSYYAPYRGYSYHRLSIGFFLDSLFYSSRYWINDPWQYRLPDVYGPYRWVRYYDDALLVNVYSGEVVDVIHNFFW